MKSKTIIFCFFALFVVGCYDLDRYPYDALSSGTFWKTDEQAKAGIMGVYARMKLHNLFGTHYASDVLTDIGLGAGSGIAEISTDTYTGRTGVVVEKWQSTYHAIMGANNVIRNVTESASITSDVKKTVKVEAKFLRALFYFHLLDYFGEVPLYDESVVLEENYNKLLNPRSSVEEITKFILDDLDEAIKELPVEWPASEYGRATKGAAYALRGKVYLYSKNYDKAVLDFEEIVLDPNNRQYNYSLYPDYEQLFKPKELGGGDASKEMIFAIQNLGGVDTNYGMNMTFYMGTRSSFGSGWNTVMPSISLADMYELKDGKTFNWNDFIPGFNEDDNVKRNTFIAQLSGDVKTIQTYPTYHQKLIDMFEQRDPRMAQTLILPYSTFLGWVANAPLLCTFVPALGASETNGFVRSNHSWYTYFFRKFVAEGNMNGLISDRRHTPINFPIIRYADVLLMLAECYNETGRIDDAVKYINYVRQRPSTNLPKLNSGPLWLEARTKEEVFNRIVKERAVEFAGEGIRFSDIRRWKLAKTLLSDKVELQLTGEIALLRSFNDRDYLWPIPAVEIEINPALRPNNPGWE